MKKSLKEAGVLSPGERKILALYPNLAPTISNTLSFLRKSDPNASIQQAAQQIMQFPDFAQNQQLAAITKMSPESINSTGQVSQMFAKAPVRQKTIAPPAQMMNTAWNALTPVAPSSTTAQSQQQISPIAQRIKASKQASPFAATQQISTQNIPQQQAQPQFQQNIMPPKLNQQQVAQRVKAVKQQNEAFSMSNLNNLGPSLQKVVKAISGLQPQDLTLLMKLLASMTQGNMSGQTGQTSMTRTTMTSSQKYSKNQILEMLKKDILREELVSTIKTQTDNYRLMESMLNEGPLSNVWSGIKNAGASVLNKIKSIGDKTGLATGQVSPEEQTKAYSGELMKMIKKAHQTRQQFKSQILKNAEIINAYQDAVSSTWDSFSKVANELGPHSGVIKSQVDELVSNLKYDLESEKEQIQSFLKVLGDLRGAAPDSSMARGAAEFKRHQEAEEARRMKNPITGRRMAGSAVDPEILKDTDKDLVDELVKKAIRGDKAALEKLRDIQAPKMRAAAKAERAKKETKK